MTIDKDIKLFYCNVKKSNWENIEVDYIFKVLSNKITKIKKQSENLIEINQKYIFS